MLVYRLCKEKYSNLDGEGAAKTTNSWNSKGRQVIYTSGSISLAVLEILVHFDYDLLPNDYVLLTVEIPDNCIIEKYSPEMLFRNETVIYGDDWISEKRSLILEIPSFVVVSEKNYLINPQHADFNKVRVVSKQPFKFDDRLTK